MIRELKTRSEETFGSWKKKKKRKEHTYWPGHMTHLVAWLPSTLGSLGWSPALQEMGTVVHTCDFSTWEGKAGRGEGQGHPGLLKKEKWPTHIIVLSVMESPGSGFFSGPKQNIDPTNLCALGTWYCCLEPKLILRVFLNSRVEGGLVTHRAGNGKA